MREEDSNEKDQQPRKEVNGQETDDSGSMTSSGGKADEGKAIKVIKRALNRVVNLQNRKNGVQKVK